jgi:glycosyltransferase involved in cell wall biosynthesis
MKIAIDISQIVYGTGVSTYTENLVKNLLKIDKESEYLLFAGALRRKKDVLSIFPQARVFPIPPTLADLVWNRLHIFPIEKLIGGVDVLHTSDWVEPPSKAFKVTTVHDLIPLKFPRMIHPEIVKVHKRRLSLVKNESDRIIVPSISTKQDLIDFGVKEEKIRVIAEANNIERSTSEEVAKIKSKYKISGDYLLAIASSFYKNIDNVIKAFDLSSAGKDLKLVIIGRQSNTNIEERRGIRLTGFVSKDEYAALCTGAKALIFPSLYEGFGIAILDAFACGTPVVTSNISSMPEVAGEAAELVDPDDPSSISEGIEKILRGPKGFIERGLARVKDFSWEKTAEETLGVYKEAVSKT